MQLERATQLSLGGRDARSEVARRVVAELGSGELQIVSRIAQGVVGAQQLRARLRSPGKSASAAAASSARQQDDAHHGERDEPGRGHTRQDADQGQDGVAHDSKV